MKETEEGSSSNLCRSCHKHDVNYTKSTCLRSKSPLETGTLAETALTKTTFWGPITPDLKLLLLRFQTFCNKKSGIWQNGHTFPSGQEVSTIAHVHVDIHHKVWICWNTSISLEGVQLVGETPSGMPNQYEPFDQLLALTILRTCQGIDVPSLYLSAGQLDID